MGSGPGVPGAHDPPHGRRADLLAEAREFAVHPAVSPGGVLPCEPQHQVLDFLAGLRASRPMGVGP